ncbi:MAG: type II secretion system protein GspC, partial [Pseudomonadota bacterium]
MTLGNYNLNTFWLHISRYQNQINLLVVVLLSVYLLAFAAELTWRLIPVSANNAQSAVRSSPTASRQSNNTARVNIQQLSNLKLFGDPVVQASVPVVETRIEDAPETNLNLTLTGVVTSSTTGGSAAIIENQGNQNTYGIGDKIDGTNATIEEVYADRLIIKNGPKHETLMLEGIDFSQNAPVPSSTSRRNNAAQSATNSPEPRRPALTLSNDALAATQNLKNSPSNFTDFISIAPVRNGQGLKGYRVSPGKKPELFNAAGLVAGDILVDINGLDLTDPRQS